MKLLIKFVFVLCLFQSLACHAWGQSAWYLKHPGTLSSTELESLLVTQPHLESVWSWSHTANNWLVKFRNDPGNHSFLPLTALEAGQGYWFRVTGAVTFPSASSQPTLSLPSGGGWRLLGTQIALTASSALSGLPSYETSTSAGTLWIYEDGLWKVYANGTLANESPLKSFPVLAQIPANSGFWVGLGTASNRPPVAESLSVQSNPSTLVQRFQLLGHDPDGDTVSYALVSANTGNGYTLAVATTQGGLNLTLDPNFLGTLSLQYRVSDGQLFSDSASIEIKVSTLASTSAIASSVATLATSILYGKGNIPIPPEVYAQLPSAVTTALAEFDYTLVNTASAVDLSANFPTPGNQGQQGSCTAWATAYALKSYQERLEEGWSLESYAHLYSPAFIYNQINGGVDQGSSILDAMSLIVNQGAATWLTMPYTEYDYTRQPSTAAQTEASFYKAFFFLVVRNFDTVKNLLANRRPVVTAIDICSDFYNVSGPNAVYASENGAFCGSHAVTIVGYDNNLYGGAFKFINSWGTSWGDKGYFWIPYDFFAQIGYEFFTLQDKENGISPSPSEIVAATTTVPNIAVKNWNVTYASAQPGDSGQVEYTVTNTGSQPTTSPTNICLMLSANNDISTGDYYVACEAIATTLAAGAEVVRNSTNPLNFKFPQGVPEGEYYLGLWVDEKVATSDSDRTNNISFANNKVTLQSPSVDLAVSSWYATWTAAGQGSMTYDLYNRGAMATHQALAGSESSWQVQLVLSTDRVIGNGDEILLVAETINSLAAKTRLQRTSSNPLSFQLNTALSGLAVTPGSYYLGLWLDPQGRLNDSNKLNNYVINQAPVTISTLPDLKINTFSVTWNLSTLAGTWNYQITNQGQGTVSTSWNLRLLLSQDALADTNDVVLDQQTFSAALTAGQSLTVSTPRSFSLSSVNAGTYFVILQVDAGSTVSEANERNNLALFNKRLQLSQGQPDFAISLWSSTWARLSGNGTFSYILRNRGSGALDRPLWISLVLDADSSKRGDEYVLHTRRFSESWAANSNLTSGGVLKFNAYRTIYGQRVPPGTYALKLWVDEGEEVSESDETNNTQVDRDSVVITSASPRLTAEAELEAEERAEVPIETLQLKLWNRNSVSEETERLIWQAPLEMEAFNGSVLPSEATRAQWHQQLQERLNRSGLERQTSEGTSAPEVLPLEGAPVFTKRFKASNPLIFPVSERIMQPSH